MTGSGTRMVLGPRGAIQIARSKICRGKQARGFAQLEESGELPYLDLRGQRYFESGPHRTLTGQSRE